LTTTTAVSDVVEFLRAHPPFDALDADDVDAVAASAEVEFHAAGQAILAQGADPVEHLRVVRSGAVELVHDGRVLDLLGEGELFGHASMLSGLPTGFTARAAEDTLCYRIPGDVARGVLARPEGLRYVARSLLDLPRPGAPAPDDTPSAANQPVGSLLRAGLVICPPDTSIREAARRMTTAGATSVVVDLDGSVGIVTDYDLRSRVLADGLSSDAPISAAMTAPAYTVAPDRLGGDVLLDMLDRGIRHFPVVAPTGEVVGVVHEADLVAVERRSSFQLRRAIARARTPDELVHAASSLHPMLLGLWDARVSPLSISAIYSVVLDALTRRFLELAIEQAGEPPPVAFAWLALGSQARREAVLSSDGDSAIVWFPPNDGTAVDEDAVVAYLVGIAEKVVDGLSRCGVAPDRQQATAADPLFIRSVDSWRAAARSWLEDPAQDQALILVSVVVDSRPVWGLRTGAPVSEAFRGARQHRGLLAQLARLALSYRPPTGFLRGLVVEHSGEYRGRLDIKHGGVVPIVDLARWAGMAAGVTSASTTERLRAAGDAGTLSKGDARTLQDAFELVVGLRLQHQMEQLRDGQPPDDYLDPAALSPLTRTYLREAFRAVASVQKRVANEVAVGAR
jgi:CBS domain-containing protein